jgi:hypothetical protein
MPAQWPIFINNLSKKLASRTSKGPDDIGTFVANEYFNAVKTAQTPFGNLHKSGQKPILEAGFKKAFNMLFKSLEPQLEDKFGNPLYDDMFQRLPGIDLSMNPDCDFEEWTIKNKQTITPFEFYPLFPTTCIIPKPIVPEINIFGDIGISSEIPETITSENVDRQPELRYVTMSVFGGDGTSPYEFTYSLNGIIQPTLTSDSQGVVRFLAPTDPGKYDYTFISAMDASKMAEIKNINRSASIEIKENSRAVEVKVDPAVAPSPNFQLVKPMTEAQKVDELLNRVLYENDGTEEYLDWINRLSYHGDLAKKVSKKALDFFDKEVTSIKNEAKVAGISISNASTNKPINISIFNSQYSLDAAKTALKKVEAAYDVFNKPVYSYNAKKNEQLIAAQEIQKKYAYIEVIKAKIYIERVEIAIGRLNNSEYKPDSRNQAIERLNLELAVELRLIDINIANKNIKNIKDIDSIEFIMAKVKINLKELSVLNTRNRNSDGKEDILNRELTVLALRAIKLKNKIKQEKYSNDRIFQEEHSDRPDNVPSWITSRIICVFSYVKGIDNNQKGAPSKNPIIAANTTSYNNGYVNYGNYNGNNSRNETFSQWSKRTEPGRINAKLTKYEIEKVKYRDLKIRHINQIAEDNKKAENPGGADDPYCVMSKCIIDYWKSTAVQPFAAAPPILPCLIPSPGKYIPIYYGSEAKLGADLRKAWNTGKRFKMEPTLQTATKAVSAAVAVSCAKHLLELKFLYNGQIPTPGGPVPMIGFSPLAL